MHKERKSDWAEEELTVLENSVYPRYHLMPKYQQHQLRIAAKLNDILRKNEAKGKNRDDALAFAQGVRVLVQENTDAQGQVNETQFMKDLQFFMIDMGSGTSQSFIVSRFSGFKPSNVAYNLYAGPRIRTTGWKEQLVDDLDPGSNQVHHFSASFIDTFKNGPKEAIKHSYILENTFFNKGEKNPPDILLSAIAIKLAVEVKAGIVPLSTALEIVINFSRIVDRIPAPNNKAEVLVYKTYQASHGFCDLYGDEYIISVNKKRNDRKILYS